MKYLTGASGGLAPSETRDWDIGLMLQPGNGYLNGLADGWPFWAADNGCFAQGASFSMPRWYKWLDRVPRERCLFAVAPDVFPDAAQTLERSVPVLPILRGMGFRAAFVAQNGAEAISLPWESFDVLFLGGTTDWKLGPGPRRLITSAHHHGKVVHMGRVNSARRLRYAATVGCDTSDGTFLKYGPDVNRSRLYTWLAQRSFTFHRRECGD